MHALICEQVPSMIGVECHKVQRWILLLKSLLEPRRSIGHGFTVAGACSNRRI
jgi:hypothetical protein